MEIKHTHLYKHFFLYTLLVLVSATVAASYFRFMIYHDYIVEYEGICDPLIETCFIGCEDEECTEEYYYSIMTKYVPDLYNKCGNDITDCDEANKCLDEDRNCSIVFCEPTADTGEICKMISEEEILDSEDSELLQNNEVINN